MMNKINYLLAAVIAAALFLPRPSHAEDYDSTVIGLGKWLAANRDEMTGLPYSTVGDYELEHVTTLYDSAVVSLAYLALGRVENARRIIDYYINTPRARRLGGFIESINVTKEEIGHDLSVRAGPNAWLGLAAFHLYKATKEKKYLDLARQQADFVVSLQDLESGDPNFGGIGLGPVGEGANDQHINFDITQPEYPHVFSTRYALETFALLDQLSKGNGRLYNQPKADLLAWLRRVAFNREDHRFNRGAGERPDTAVSTQDQVLGISALGLAGINGFEPELASRLVEFVETNCGAVSVWQGEEVRGMDFTDEAGAKAAGRPRMVSPELSFQFANACLRMERDCTELGQRRIAPGFREKREDMLKQMVKMAVKTKDGLAFPCASLFHSPTGHGGYTPARDSLSAIGAAYAILAFKEFDPLYDYSGQ